MKTPDEIFGPQLTTLFMYNPPSIPEENLERIWRGHSELGLMQVKLTAGLDNGLHAEQELLIQASGDDLRRAYRVISHPLPNELEEKCNVKELICRTTSGAPDPMALDRPTIAVITSEGNLQVYYIGFCHLKPACILKPVLKPKVKGSSHSPSGK